MCKFIEALEEEERGFVEKYPYYSDELSPRVYRQFKAIQINENLWFSIQASYAHYCTPQKTLETLEDYTHWEFALIGESGFLRVTEVLPDFPSLAEIEYYEAEVYAYVPIDLVEDLYLALKKC